MAKIQTRRTISLSRPVYEAAKLEAAARGISAAQFVEDALVAYEPKLMAAVQVAAARVRYQHYPRQARAAMEVLDRAVALRKPAPKRLLEREIVKPCRREDCRWPRLHEEGSCL
jgi:predicted RNase H-like nuclease